MTDAPQAADTDRLERIRQRNSGTASPDRDPGHRRPRSRAVAVVVGLMLAGTMIWILLPQQVRTILGSFLFQGDDVDKPAGVLSGGEKTRLALATLVASSANVLLLDEPTNNLDPASREEILNALRTYEGAVVLVTHDPGAVRALEPERVIVLPDGTEDLWNDEYMEIVELA